MARENLQPLIEGAYPDGDVWLEEFGSYPELRLESRRLTFAPAPVTPLQHVRYLKDRAEAFRLRALGAKGTRVFGSGGPRKEGRGDRARKLTPERSKRWMEVRVGGGKGQLGPVAQQQHWAAEGPRSALASENAKPAFVDPHLFRFRGKPFQLSSEVQKRSAFYGAGRPPDGASDEICSFAVLLGRWMERRFLPGCRRSCDSP
jgi:hypothetical protein